MSASLSLSPSKSTSSWMENAGFVLNRKFIEIAEFIEQFLLNRKKTLTRVINLNI